MHKPASSDYSKMMAALVAARHAARSRSADNGSLADSAAAIESALARSGWQIDRARGLKPEWSLWLVRPYHCWRFKALLRELSESTSTDASEVTRLRLLTRIASMIEFGVPVNEQWYRRLINAIGDGRTTESALRTLLSRLTVYWDRNGSLLVQNHHWFTRLLLWTVIALFGASALSLFSLAAAVAFSYGIRNREFIGFTYYGLLFAALWWAAWWMGPISWKSASKLREVLDLQPHEATSKQVQALPWMPS